MANSIIIELQIHAFAEEKLCDEIFDQPERFGFAGTDIMVPLSHCRNFAFDYTYDAETTVSDVIDTVKLKIWGADHERVMPVRIAFISGSERFYISNGKKSFQELLPKYLDPKNSGRITVGVYVSQDAGEVDGISPLRFYIHSRESGKHHEAHVHVRDSGHRYEASITISDGAIIAGELPSKLEKLAKKQVLNNQKYYFECWNTMSDGLKVDINHHFGFIQF